MRPGVQLVLIPLHWLWSYGDSADFHSRHRYLLNLRYYDIIYLTGDIVCVIFDSRTDNCLDMRYTVYGLETAITRDLYLDS